MKRIWWIIVMISVLSVASACAGKEPDAPPDTTEPPAAATERVTTDAHVQTTEEACFLPPDPKEPSALGTERDVTAAEAMPAEMQTVRTHPGMIMSDVYVQLWDGDVAPGLREEDANTVKQIIASQTWGASYDNLSDYRIEAEGVQYAYDTSSGILTAADDRAAKLSDAQRETLNVVLAKYAEFLAQ